MVPILENWKLIMIFMVMVNPVNAGSEVTASTSMVWKFAIVIELECQDGHLNVSPRVYQPDSHASPFQHIRLLLESTGGFTPLKKNETSTQEKRGISTRSA